MSQLDFKGIRGILFDMFGTLVTVDPNFQFAVESLYQKLVQMGFQPDFETFKRTLARVQEYYNKIRYEELREVTNAVWISNVLNELGFDTKPKDGRIEDVVESQFAAFNSSVALMPGIIDLLLICSERYRVGLVSNFTYAPALRQLLKRFGFETFFDTIVISHEIGLRKPHPNIFAKALDDLGISSGECVMVGNDLKEDIQGARRIKMKAILVNYSGTGEEIRALQEDKRPNMILDSTSSLIRFLK